MNGMAKVAPEKRPRFLLNGVRKPLEWLDHHKARLVEAISGLMERVRKKITIREGIYKETRKPGEPEARVDPFS